MTDPTNPSMSELRSIVVACLCKDDQDPDVIDFYVDAIQSAIDTAVAQELTQLLKNVPMPELSYGQVENRIAEVRKVINK